MSVAQLKSINERKLRLRAEAYARITRNKAVGMEAREKAYMEGYMVSLEDLRKQVEACGGRPGDIGAAVSAWLDEQPDKETM